MRDLIVLLNQIQLLLDRWVVLVFVLPYLEKNLNHVLDPLIDVFLIKDAPKSIKNHNGYRHVHFFEVVSDFSRQTNGNFNAVVRRFVEEQQQHLYCYHLVCYLLIA